MPSRHTFKRAHTEINGRGCETSKYEKLSETSSMFLPKGCHIWSRFEDNEELSLKFQGQWFQFLILYIVKFSSTSKLTPKTSHVKIQKKELLDYVFYQNNGVSHEMRADPRKEKSQVPQWWLGTSLEHWVPGIQTGPGRQVAQKVRLWAKRWQGTEQLHVA